MKTQGMMIYLQYFIAFGAALAFSSLNARWALLRADYRAFAFWFGLVLIACAATFFFIYLSEIKSSAAASRKIRTRRGNDAVTEVKPSVSPGRTATTRRRFNSVGREER